MGNGRQNRGLLAVDRRPAEAVGWAPPTVLFLRPGGGRGVQWGEWPRRVGPGPPSSSVVPTRQPKIHGGVAERPACRVGTAHHPSPSSGQ